MHRDGSKKPQRSVSLPTLIAWLSLCLLAAAWGHALDEQWQIVWAEAGAFGLVSAVGLGSLETTRAARAKWINARIVRARLEGGLARLQEHSAALESINAAVRRLAEHAVKERQRQHTRPGRTKRWQSLLLNEYPLEVSPVEEAGAVSESGPTQPISGSLRQISSRAVTFEHAELFASKLVLLTFELEGSDHVSFVVDVIWTNEGGDGFVSGGTVMAVGVPSDQLVAGAVQTA